MDKCPACDLEMPYDPPKCYLCGCDKYCGECLRNRGPIQLCGNCEKIVCRECSKNEWCKPCVEKQFHNN